MRACAAVALAVVLVCALVPATALAYFDRGSVEVSLGSSAIEVTAGQTGSVTMSFTPASDEQTEGCGMPKCPQGCSESCCDENGQCQCAGKEYSTYYPTATASSSNAGVAVAVCSGQTLTIYAKQAGEADITVRASLRQHTDGEATVHVTVTGEAATAGGSADAFVDVPEQADASQLDKLDVVDKTVMNRPIHMVRISDALDARSELATLAGQDGDVTFWSGDTYYHPDYSLTFKGNAYTADALVPFSCALAVSTQAEGALYQALYGKDCFVAVDFAQKGALPAAATVYAYAAGAISDDKDVALFSYDAASKSFVREDAQAQMIGGYAVFTVSEGKTYVVSCRDLTSDANTVVTGGASASSSAGSCCDPQMSSMGASSASSSDAGAGQQAIPPFAILIGAVVIALVAAGVGAGVAVLIVSRKRKGASCAADSGERPQS